MDNQHKMIKGYRDLSQAEIDLMNKIKLHAKVIGELVHEVETVLHAHVESEAFKDDEVIRFYDADVWDWLGRAKNDLQDGFMKLTRAVAQPTTF